MKEIWKDIPEYENYYQASNQGRIKSLDRYVIRKRLGKTFEIFLKGQIMKSYLYRGYNMIRLCKNGIMKKYTIGNLVLLTFIGNHPAGKEMSHLNSISEDDKLNNLKWETHKENMHRLVIRKTLIGEKHGRAILTRKNVIRIKKLLEKGQRVSDIVRLFPVCSSTLYQIKLNQIWKHIGNTPGKLRSNYARDL